MNNTKTKKPLPKLSTRTLDYEDLAKVVGGRIVGDDDCSACTKSVCHVDGCDDADPPS